jgi:poly(beta-D-mannuronate) lyase
MKTFTLPNLVRVKRPWAAALLSLTLSCPAFLHGQTSLFTTDFETDTLGDPPAGWVLDDPNDGNTADNGAAVIDSSSAEATPIDGQSLYIYDKVDSENTWLKRDLAGGTNLSAVHLQTDFARAFEDADENVRVHLTIGRSGDRLNNSDFRMFELRIQNNGDLRINHNPTQGPGDDDSTETVASFGDETQTLDIFANSHDSAAVDYDSGGLSGTLQPNTMDVYMNGVLTGTYFFLQTPDPNNAPEINFADSDADFGQIGLYQDTGRTGGIVFDNMSLFELPVDIPTSGGTVVYSEDFEADTPGEQPSGPWTFSPSANDATNGSVVVDATTTPVNPLSGQSLYVYDLNGDGSSGESTHIRTDFLGGDNVSAASVTFDFQPMYTVGDDDDDTRVHFSIGQAGLALNNSDFRLFEIRMQNNGGFRVEASRDGAGGDRGSSEVGTFDPTQPGTVALFINSRGSETVAYDNGIHAGSLAPNTMDVYLNGSYTGTYLTLKTPDPDNAPEIDFWSSDADLGQIAFYQDSRRQGGVVFDNIVVQQLSAGDDGGGSEELQMYIEGFDFEDQVLGEQPEMPFPTAFTPSSNTSDNGFVVIDQASNPANPMATGKALHAYDNVDNASSHMRFDFDTDNTDNVRVDFDFQRMYEVPVEDEDSRIHVALAPAGTAINNSDFRPFEIRILNSGNLVVNYNPTGAVLEGRDSEVVAQYETTGSNSLTFFANGNNANALPYEDEVLGSGMVPANTMVLFLNGTKIGEYGFINTPDPGAAPQIAFFESIEEFGRFGIYQDTSRPGGIAFDNLSIREFARLGPPEAPTGLAATSTGPQSILLEWTDNAINETGFIVEISEGSSWSEIATADADATSLEVTGLTPETEYTFRVLATNGTPSTPSNEATATTDVQLLPIIAVEPEDQLVPSGSSITLSVEATGPAPLTYQWFTGMSGDTASPVEGATASSFTTPILEATTSYWVRVSNANGSDDSVTTTIEVFEPRVIRVVNLAQLEALLPDALPGDTYVLDAGSYPDAQIRFEGTGTEFAPITLKAETPGAVVFTGDSYMEIGGEWLVAEGFLWTDGWNQSLDQVISFRAGSSTPARNCRVTQCAIVDFSPPDPSVDRDWVGMYGSDNRFDHNYLAGHSNKGVTLVVWRSNGVEDRHLIDNNHFAFRASGGGENGWETIRVGTSGDSLSSSKTIVEYNLFEECNGEIEIISNKSGENIYRYNTFLKCDGMLTLRHGNNCLVEGNIFLGGGVPGSGGIRVIGENHTIINNYIEGTTGRQGGAIAIYAGVENSPLNEYFVADGTFVGNNTIVDVDGAHVLIGAGFETSNRTVLPTGVIVTNNLFAQALTSSSATDGPAITGAAVAGQLYAGNIASGVMLGDAPEGVTTASVTLNPGEFGLLRPTVGSPVVDAADAAYPIALDLDGQERGADQDVGADELSDGPGINLGGPLTADAVGPTWLDRSLETLPWLAEGVLPGDTVFSPWFGSFIVEEDDWLQHGELSWIYVGAVQNSNDMWIWSQVLESWLWSTSNLFPIVYDASVMGWRVYAFSPEGGGFFYDYTTQEWRVFP